MGNMNYEKISKELNFEVEDTFILVKSMQSLEKELDTTNKIINFWEDNCFRADDFEEILEQFEEDTEINEIANRIFILPSRKLVVIGIGKVREG